jgi:endonuclease-3 related protein
MGGARVTEARPRAATRRTLNSVYRALLAEYGPQQWWPVGPGDGPTQRLEICLGAILTQNTAWRGAAAALARLRAADMLSLHALLGTPEAVLADLVRPAGHFNVKASKLREFARVALEEHGDLDALLTPSARAPADGGADEVRVRLLEIWGVGPETADAIVLYAARLPTFVIDAYSRRLVERLALLPAVEGEAASGRPRYERERRLFIDRIDAEVPLLNQWHALIVRHGQNRCRRRDPLCAGCPLLARCPHGRRELGLGG